MTEETIQERYRRLATQEYEKSTHEVKIHGPIKAHKTFLARLSDQQSTVTQNSEQQLACKAGCDHCCTYSRVGAFPAEIFQIVDYMRGNFEPSKLEELKTAIDERAKIFKPLSKDERLSINKPCIFLEESGQCGIYEVRPATCRNHHALDVEKCKQAIDEPDNLSIPNTFIEELHMVNEALTYGHKTATEHAKIDANFYELNIALSESISNSKCKKKWAQGKRPFSASAYLSGQ